MIDKNQNFYNYFLCTYFIIILVKDTKYFYYIIIIDLIKFQTTHI